MTPLTEVGKVMNSVLDLFHLRGPEREDGQVTWTVSNTDLRPTYTTGL